MYVSLKQDGGAGSLLCGAEQSSAAARAGSQSWAWRSQLGAGAALPASPASPPQVFPSAFASLGFGFFWVLSAGRCVKQKACSAGRGRERVDTACLWSTTGLRGWGHASALGSEGSGVKNNRGTSRVTISGSLRSPFAHYLPSSSVLLSEQPPPFPHGRDSKPSAGKPQGGERSREVSRARILKTNVIPQFSCPNLRQRCWKPQGNVKSAPPVSLQAPFSRKGSRRAVMRLDFCSQWWASPTGTQGGREGDCKGARPKVCPSQHPVQEPILWDDPEKCARHRQRRLLPWLHPQLLAGIHPEMPEPAGAPWRRKV